MNTLARQKYGQIILSIPIVFYFIFLLAYITPKNEFRDRLIAPVEIWWNYWRLDQNWALFSPVIRNINFHATAIIRLEDGSQLIFPFPRNSKQGIMGELSGEKWRKFAIDSLPWTSFKPFWPDVAQFIGRQCYDVKNKPESISLFINWTDIPKPEALVPREQFPHQTRFQTIFVYRYQSGDCQ